MSSRVCLLVDNPLRDLDGLVLLAWQLSLKGAEVFLVPMYEQGFDIPAIQPHVVVANYIRPNNRDLLAAYRRAGMRVAVLDTEGAAGKSADDFAAMVGRMNCDEVVDLYCMWGEQQFAAFSKAGVVSSSALRLTGCPRYDYCSAPWRQVLSIPGGVGDYVLINTNFPVVNPRFSKTSAIEEANMTQAGFAAGHARQFVNDARLAHDAVKVAIRALANKFPETTFVLRPHPFEKTEAYNELCGLGNVQVRQEGASLGWIDKSRFLVHQNCSTALEAVMLGREAISLEWFNTPALRLIAPSSVSLRATSQQSLESLTSLLLTGVRPALNDGQSEARERVIRELYYLNDGRSAERVAEAILEIAGRPLRNLTSGVSRSSLRSRVIAIGRRALGYRGFESLRRLEQDAMRGQRKKAKQFSVEAVQALLDRINAVAGKSGMIGADLPHPGQLYNSRMFSQLSVRVRRRA